MVNRIRKVLIDKGFRSFAFFCREHLSRKSSQAVRYFLEEKTAHARPEDDGNREIFNSIITEKDWVCEDTPDVIIVRGASKFYIKIEKKTGVGMFVKK